MAVAWPLVCGVHVEHVATASCVREVRVPSRGYGIVVCKGPRGYTGRRGAAAGPDKGRSGRTMHRGWTCARTQAL